MASTTTKDLREAAAEGTQKAQNVAQAGYDKAKEFAGQASEQAGRAAATVGQNLESLAGTIRGSAPSGGVLGSAASTVAGSLESSGRYLREEGIGGMAEDVTETIRRNPLTAVLVGIGFGFLLARVTKG